MKKELLFCMLSFCTLLIAPLSASASEVQNLVIKSLSPVQQCIPVVQSWEKPGQKLRMDGRQQLIMLK